MKIFFSNINRTKHVTSPEHLFHLAPSLAATFPSLDLTLTPKEQKEDEEEEKEEVDEDEEEEEGDGELGLMEELCSEAELLKHKGSQPIINIVKVWI